MKTYTITIPAFTSVIAAKSKDEALEQFWFDCDCARDDPERDTLIIKITDKIHGR